MFIGFLPAEGPAVLIVVPEDGLFGEASGCDLEVVGARTSVKVPVRDFQQAEQADKSQGLYAEDGELVAPEDYLLQSRYVRDRKQQIGQSNISDGYPKHGPVVTLF